MPLTNLHFLTLGLPPLLWAIYKCYCNSQKFSCEEYRQATATVLELAWMRNWNFISSKCSH